MSWLTQIPAWVWPTGLIALVAAWLLVVGIRASLRAWQRTRWKRRPPIELSYPVVLIHGIFGFDEIGRWGLEQKYFRGIGQYLNLLGVETHYPRLSPADATSVRAERLARFVRELDRDRVILVAHSMGGLDARYAIAHCGLASAVTSVVTIGCPHRGTPIAQIGGHPMLRITRWLLDRVGVSTAAVDGLTESALVRFNQRVPDDPRVSYFSVVAAARWSSIVLNPALWLPYVYLRWRAGPNDGMVPASSQAYGEVLLEVDADHWAQVGWSWRADARGIYEQVLRELACRASAQEGTSSSASQNPPHRSDPGSVTRGAHAAETAHH